MRVSFLIPLYNCLPLTQAMLASLQSTLPAGLDHEIILIDDASTDGTRDWLRTLSSGSAHPHIRVLLNDRNLDFAAAPVSADAVGTLLKRIEDGTISGKGAKDVLLAMADGEGDADAVIEKRGLKQISDTGALEAAVDNVIAANPKLVDDYRGGKEKAFNSLVGQVMKATQGKANPVQVNEILKRKLSEEA